MVFLSKALNFTLVSISYMLILDTPRPMVLDIFLSKHQELKAPTIKNKKNEYNLLIISINSLLWMSKLYVITIKSIYTTAGFLLSAVDPNAQRLIAFQS